MTANAMSSAPTPHNISSPPEDVYDDDAARHTEEFLANMAQEAQCYAADGYLSDSPIHITANMMENDDIWILSTAPTPAPTDKTPKFTELGRGEQISAILPVIPAPAHEYFWQAEHGHLTKR